MKKIVRGIAILATVVLGACAGPGEVMRVPFNINGQKGTMVVHNQQVPNWMLDTDKLAMNYIVKGDLTPDQLLGIAEGERVCRIYAGATHPSRLVAVVSDGVLYGAAGVVGGGLAAEAFPHAIAHQYARYTGTIAAASGTATGIRSTGNTKFSFEDCSQSTMNFFMASVRVLRE